MFFANSTYRKNKERGIGIFSLILILNIYVLPITFKGQVQTSAPKCEITYSDIDSTIFNTLQPNSKRVIRSVSVFHKIDLFTHVTSPTSLNRSSQIVLKETALNIDGIKMEESFLLTHFSLKGFVFCHFYKVI